jgi:diguanylate cyclase (GGDEF)-like protein
MTKKKMDNLRRQRLKIIAYLIGVLIVALVIEVFILGFFTRKSANKSSLMRLNQVVSLIRENEANENSLIETLKEDYMIRAQTAAYILDARPEAETDISELNKIAGLLSVDEIHLFDATGMIYSGTEPQYYGYSFDSGEQMGYFKPMLENRDLSMCQDVTPNTAEGKSMMYAITWNEAGDKMIQVGIEPVRLLDELRSNEITEVVANMPVYEGLEIWVADAETREICATTSHSITSGTLDDLGIKETDFSEDTVVSNVIRINGYHNYCKARRAGEYIVVAACSSSVSVGNIVIAVLIEFVYLMMAGVTITFTVTKLIRANHEVHEQMAILKSMSDIYNSMLLIDLESDTMVEYSARDTVSDFIRNATTGATETLKQIMTALSEEEDCEKALEFTDLLTLSGRMQDMKTISKELRSKEIGWYRGSFITIEADGEGRPTKVIYVTQNIDQEKKKEAELLYKSNVDELTGLYNRRAYEDDIAERGDAIREKNFVFVSLDVNGLKPVNDTLGHSAGDELLTGAAGCMKRCFGSYGKIYRTGGDEFAAIIFASETQLENIKKDFAQTTAEWSGKLVKSLSVSTGYVARREVNTDSVHVMANLADKKMYEAKAAFYENSPDLART